MNQQDLKMLKKFFEIPMPGQPTREVSIDSNTEIWAKIEKLINDSLYPTSKIEFSNKREEVLLTANKIVNGDRQEAYGDPTESFKRIATLWSSVLLIEITAIDVARMMILLKVSHSLDKNDIDNWIDIAGYAGLAAEL